MSTAFFERHLSIPVIGILRTVDPHDVAARCAALWDARVGLVEVTIEREQGEQALRLAVEAGRDRSMPVGAGSVRTVAQLERVAELGAEFIVSPGLSSAVVLAAARLGLPCLPGVATASEIMLALDLGCTWMKAFPAATLGPSWISAQLAPFPEVKFIATGGIGAHNATQFLEAGAAGVGLGSSVGVADLPAIIGRATTEDQTSA